MHPLVLEADEMQDYPEAGWTELIETMKAGSEGAQWRAHGVSKGVRDVYYRMTMGENPDLPWKVHRYMAPHRPTWSDQERRSKIAIYGGTEDNIDYRRNIFGEHGDTHNPVFVLARLMACCRINESTWASTYNDSIYMKVKVNDELHRKMNAPIEMFLDGIPGTHLSEEYTSYWAGMDVGFTNDPSEILVFGVTRPKGSKLDLHRLLLRVQLQRISAIDQASVIMEIFRIYGSRLRAFAMDKMQPVSEPVLTPRGWVSIGQVAPGDQVIGSDGKPTLVTGVYPQVDRRVRRVTFTDGSWTRCGPEHLWKARRPGMAWRTTLTDDLGPGWQIPRVAPVEMQAMDFPVDPYLLGALLGDGNIRAGSVRFSSADPEVLMEVEARLPFGVTLKKASGRYDYELAALRGRDHLGRWASNNPLVKGLRDLGLTGVKAPDKFIPEPYLRGSIEQRLSLLRGLMDTDGYASGADHQAFTTSSRRLAEGVVELVQSLGGVARVRVKLTPGLDQVYVSVQMPEGMNPFLLSRKAKKFRPARSQVRVVASVEEDAEEESVCIRVAAEDHLYVTRHYLVTHNTGNGLPIWQETMRGGRLEKHSARIKGYGFSEKKAVEFDDRPMERREKPQDLVIEKNIVDFATDELRKLVDNQAIELPYDLELLTEWQGQQVQIVKDMGSAGGIRRKYSDGGFHTLDAGRMFIAGKALEHIESVLKPRRRGPVLDAFVG